MLSNLMHMANQAFTMDLLGHSMFNISAPCLQQALVEEAERLANPENDYSFLTTILQHLRNLAARTGTTFQLAEERKQELAGALALLYQLFPADSMQTANMKSVIEVRPLCTLSNRPQTASTRGLNSVMSRLDVHRAYLGCLRDAVHQGDSSTTCSSVDLCSPKLSVGVHLGGASIVCQQTQWPHQLMLLL